MHNKDLIACATDRIEVMQPKGALLADIIRNRRSVFADYYIDKPVPKPLIEEVLTNAIWAPNYKMTQPWRFIVLQGEQLKQFGSYLADYYKGQYERLINYPSRAGCIIVIIMRRNTKVVIEEWEELAAVACAVQNMALTCTAYDIGGYWDSCSACIAYADRFELAENERCLGFFYMGYYDLATYTSNKRRTGIEKKVTWLT